MRRKAREICFKLIYENLFNSLNAKNDLSFHMLCDEETVLPEDDKIFVDGLFDSFLTHKQQIASEINPLLIGFSPDRAFKIDLAILNLAVAENKFYDQVDKRIIINEALELAKKFSTEKSGRFINGVLGSIIKD